MDHTHISIYKNNNSLMNELFTDIIPITIYNKKDFPITEVGY